MLEAYIIDQLKKRDERESEPLAPTLELPLYPEDETPPTSKKKKEDRIWIIDFN